MRIKAKHFNLVFSSLVALFMSFFISFFMVLVNTGFSSSLLPMWMKSFVTGFVIALPTSIVVIPLIRNFLLKYVDEG